MPVRTHKPTRCSNKLRLPPSPLPCIPVPAEILTPPPSPQRATSFDDAEAVIPKFPYWGYLKALNPYTPWKNWYFSREKNRYSIGTNPSMDHCMGSVIAVPDLQCIITWDGTDSPDSVQITDYAGAHNASYAAMGTYVRTYTACHGKCLDHPDRGSEIRHPEVPTTPQRNLLLLPLPKLNETQLRAL